MTDTKRTVMLALLLLVATRLHATTTDAKLQAFLERVQSGDDAVRLAARLEAPDHGAAAIAPLGKLLTSVNVNVAVTARAAIEKIVHHAGRPGANAERPPVIAELTKLLKGDAAATVRREMIHLISFIGEDSIVPEIAKLLRDQDRHVREAARLALERIPGRASVEALITAARTSAVEDVPDLLFSLGKKTRDAVPFLVQTAGSSRGPIRSAALEALAHLAAPEAVPLFDDAIKESSIEDGAAAADRSVYFREYLRLADNLAAIGDDEVARAIYHKALAEAPLDYQRERALLRLSPRGSVSGITDLIASLNDRGERVRHYALEQLTRIEDDGVTERLRKAYLESGKTDAGGNARPALLRAVWEREKDSAKELVTLALESSDSELKLVALDIVGRLSDPSLTSLFEKVAQTGSPQGRQLAVRGQLQVASKLLGGGKNDEALAVYKSVLSVTPEETVVRQVIRGLEKIGDPAVIEALDPLLSNPAVATDAAEVYITFAAKEGAAGKKDKAESCLMNIVRGTFTRDLKSRAAAELTKIGRDPLRSARAQGFVVDWWLIGPIEDSDGKALETRFFPENVIDLVNIQRIGPRRFRWQRLRDLPLKGAVNLVPIFRRSARRVAYAHTELESPGEQDVLFKIGSNDGVACWLNGMRVHLRPGSRELKIDEDVVDAKLAKGKNRILLKVNNVEGAWGFAFRITSAGGEPLELKAMIP